MTEDATALRIALAQVNVTVGDIEGNARLIAEWIASARERGAAAGRLSRAGGHGLPG